MTTSRYVKRGIFLLAAGECTMSFPCPPRFYLLDPPHSYGIHADMLTLLPRQ
jgi:hypothetical protein